MNGQTILKTSLLDLLYELRDQEMPLILGGGYGLYLKQLHLQQESSVQTLIPGEMWPLPRATEDLDILLKTEIVIDSSRMKPIRAALDRLGYTVISGAEYMQFVKQLGHSMNVKIDLLTGPLGSFANDARVKVDKRRVSPRNSVQLHAHRTDEALGFEQDTFAIPIRGTLSAGDKYEAIIHVPQAFTLLLMKLHALRDRCMDTKKDMARHHALDIYRVVAMMSEDEFNKTEQRIADSGEHPVIVEAKRIIADMFASNESLGSLRLREHRLWNENMAITDFLSALMAMFRLRGTGSV